MRPYLGPIWLALIAGACGGGGGGGSTTPPPVDPPFVSAPDCVGASSFVSQSAAAPANATFMRVQHIGDAGTAEQAGQVANPVTWAVGDVTGLYPPDPASAAQRGLRNDPPPNASSAFQLSCNAAGFWINTARFSHALPLVGEGPSASIAREPQPFARIYRTAADTMTIEALVQVKTIDARQPHVAEGTAQVSFFYYARDLTTNTEFIHVIGLFESRPFGVGSSGVENQASDGLNAFISSPLRTVDATGVPVRYVTVGADTELMRTVTPWDQPLPFRARVTYANFQAMLARLKAGPLPTISARPEDYRITLFGVLGEVVPGTGTEFEVALGAHVRDLRLSGGS